MTIDPANPSALPLGTFLLLRDLISERLGVWYDENKRDLLESKIADRIDALKLRTHLDYFYRLKYGPGVEDEWLNLTETLSVQETYFWREADQIRALVDELLPAFVAKGPRPIRIWSAACATGEEPYTIAIALQEAGWFDRATIEILATDMSAAALDKARRGIYRERSFRALPLSLRMKYFEPCAEGSRISDSIRDRVKFSGVNLTNPEETATFAASPFIFCRNVFIYFSTSTISSIVADFAKQMPSPGYLFVGASESLLRHSTAFDLQQVGSAFVYVKR